MRTSAQIKQSGGQVAVPYRVCPPKNRNARTLSLKSFKQGLVEEVLFDISETWPPQLIFYGQQVVQADDRGRGKGHHARSCVTHQHWRVV